MRLRLEGVPQRYPEDHIAAKGLNSLSRYNLVASEMGSPRHAKNRRDGGPAMLPNLRVCKQLGSRVAHAGEEGRINVSRRGKNLL